MNYFLDFPQTGKRRYLNCHREQCISIAAALWLRTGREILVRTHFIERVVAEFPDGLLERLKAQRADFKKEAQ